MTVIEKLAKIFIEKLESGEAPWQKPWHATGAAGRNATTNKPYRGINWWMTSLAGYKNPFWVTFNQARSLGAWVRKGETSTIIVHYNFKEVEIDGEIYSEFRGLRYYNIFNLEQIEASDDSPLKPLREAEDEVKLLSENQRIDRAEKLWERWEDKPKILRGAKAFYRPFDDTITMPNFKVFKKPEGYYATLFHEAVHATGSQNRLGRNGIIKMSNFGSKAYGLEELIAEIGAARICHDLQILPDVIDNSAAYLKSWIEAIKETPSIIYKSMTKAEKAYQYITGGTIESTSDRTKNEGQHDDNLGIQGNEGRDVENVA